MEDGKIVIVGISKRQLAVAAFHIGNMIESTMKVDCDIYVGESTTPRKIRNAKNG